MKRESHIYPLRRYKGVLENYCKNAHGTITRFKLRVSTPNFTEIGRFTAEIYHV